MNFNDFGIDSASLAGSLENRLVAARQAGFTQVMIAATDIVGHPVSTAAAIKAIRESGMRITGLEALRDFEGLTGKMHDYKIDVAKSMLNLCSQIGGRLLLVEASASVHADVDPEKIARDLRKMEVNVAVDEADVGRVATGQKMDFSVVAFPGENDDIAREDVEFHQF